MTTNPSDAAMRLRRELRTRLRTGAETLTLTAADAHLLLEEIGSLQQSNERLRRQNRRVRLRLQAATGKAGFAGGDGDDELLDDAGAAPADEGRSAAADDVIDDVDAP